MTPEESIFQSYDQVTEPRDNYVQVNLPYMDALSAVSSYQLSLGYVANKIAIWILKHKRYGATATEQEQSRLFNKALLTAEELLTSLYIGKYENGKNIKSDIANLNRRLKKLHELNIFYRWKYEGMYTFFMERFYPSWRVFNPNAYVSPKMLVKLIHSCNEAVTLVSAHHAGTLGFDWRKLSSEEKVKYIWSTEESYGKFVKDVRSKLHPDVVARLPRWLDKADLSDNLKPLLDVLLNDIGSYEGVDIDVKFRNRLPPLLEECVQKEIGEKAEAIMAKQSKTESEKEMVDEITPESASLCKNKGLQKPRKPQQKKRINPLEPEEVEKEMFSDKSIKDPFADYGKGETHPMVQFYRWHVMHHVHQDVRLNKKISSDTAKRIVDDLIEVGKKDKSFLVGWIKYFAQNHLKGNRPQYAKYTAMTAFRKTLQEYLKTAYVPQ